MNSYKKADGGATYDKEAPCHHCQERPLPGGKPWPLCGGCNRVFFCTRECLKRGWKDHRGMCKQANTTAGVTPTIQGVGDSRVLVENFVGIHRIHFIHACASAIEMQGGRDLFDFSRFTLVFNLVYNAASNGNPSLAFHIADASFLDTRDINLGDGHKLIFRSQKSEFDKARRLASQTDAANFDNIASVCYETEGVTIWGGLPISTTAHDGLRSADLLNIHGGWLIALQNLVKSGGVLRETNSNPPTVEFGKYILERRKWRFKKYTRQQLKQQRDRGVTEAAIVLDAFDLDLL